MSSFSVISKKSRLRLGVFVVVIIHIGFFYGFWHVKAGRVTNEVVELDIYGDTTSNGVSFYEALPDENCLDVVNQQAAKPALQMEQPSANENSSVPSTGSNQQPIEAAEPFVPQLPIEPARSPKCKKLTSLPDGYKKLGTNGYVGLEINIDKSGKVMRGDINRTSNFPDLDAVALKQVVETWEFEPCKKGAQAVTCKQYIKFRWKEAK